MDTPKYKELLATLALQKDEKSKIEILVSIGEELKNYDIDRALHLSEEITARSQSIGYQTGNAKALCLKGFCLRLKSDYHSGLAVLKEALSLSKKIKEKNIEAISYYYLGNIHRDLGDLANVLYNYERALVINEELGDKFYQSVILSSISNLLYDLNDFDSALQYALKCLPIFEQSSNISSIININNTLGNIYFKKELFVEALHFFEENIRLSDPDTVNYIMAESGVGKVYYKLNKFDEARKYLLNSLREAQEIDNAEAQIMCQYYLGRLYMDDNNYRQSLQNLTEAFNLAGQYLRRQDLMSIHETLSILYDNMGDVPKAFHHLKTFQSLREEIFKQKTIYELKNLQIRQEIELAQKEKEVAERTAQLKHQFMANMSHEIRTPMNAIVGLTRLLLSKNPKPDQIKYLNAIQMSSDNLLVIINDILDLSKIEAGKISIESTDFSIHEIANSVREMLLLKAEEKLIELKIHIDESVPNKVIGDPTRVNQVLINLAGNAVKFTNEGYVKINVSVNKIEEETLWVKFDIIDTGIGIAQDYIDKIFESFTQAGTDVTRKFGGTGLGLTISRQLVSLMGGDISVTSELGSGTTFSFIIPLTKATDQDLHSKESGVSPDIIEHLRNIRVLLVEDNEFNRIVAEDTLQEALPGIKIDICENGAEAVTKLSSTNYDIVLMDIQMPVMDGVTATQQIRATLPEPMKSVKIIAMTANVLKENIEQYEQAGMNEFVSKPFTTEELLQKISNVYTKPKSGEPTNNKLIDNEQNDSTVKVERITDMNFLQKFTGNNSTKINKYIGMFLDNAPVLLKNIENSLINKDYNTLKINAHSLKPQLGYMGVKEEHSNIFLIEQSAGEIGQQQKLPDLINNLIIVCEKAFHELKNNVK